MKKILFIILLFTLNAYAGKDVSDRTINYVYQPDLSATEFEFEANRANGCGSSLYRVRSSDIDVANRKFAIVLAAYTSGKKLSFHDTESCVSGRSVVSWVRITN